MFGKKKKSKLSIEEQQDNDQKVKNLEEYKRQEELNKTNVKKEETKYKYVEDNTNYKVEEKAERNPLLGFKFWFFCLGAAILLTLGIWILVDKNLGAKLSIGVTGAIIFLLGVLRVIPLFKGTKNPKTKFSILAEVLIEVIIGAFLFVVAFMMQKDGPSAMSNFVSKYYKIFLGGILYLKAVFYFVNTSLLGEDTYKLEFWSHIIIITLACVVFALNFDASTIGLLVAILCLLSGVAIGATSGGSYIKYHKYNKSKTSKKDKKKDNKNDETVILPTIDQDKDSAIVQ